MTDQITNGSLTRAERDVLDERRRQIIEEGWTAERDDEHGAAELAQAGACYGLVAAGHNPDAVRERFWPFLKNWKPSTDRRDLVKASALLIAEIERLDRWKDKQ